MYFYKVQKMRQQNIAIDIYWPLKVFVAYIIFTILLFVFGPWEYKDVDLWGVGIYILFVILLFSAGYHHVVSRFKNNFYKDKFVCANNFKRLYFIGKFGLLLQLVLTCILAVSDYSQGRIQIDSFINPGQVYISALDFARESQDVSIVGQIKTLVSPIIFLSNAFFLFHYSKFVSRWRYIFVFTLFFQLIYEMVTKGAQKGVFDLFILFVAVSILQAYYNRTQLVRLMKFISFFFLGVLSIFIFFQLSRLVAYDALSYSGVSRMFLNRDGLFFSIFGDSLGMGMALFINYVSQGYYGLSLTMQLPFEWTYGLGNSFALTSYFEQYFGVYGIFEKTYPARMDAYFGWPAKMYWHSFFPWVASDLTFPGAALLMYVLGRIYARSFVDSLIFESPLGICLFYFITILLLYLPANNQLMQTREMMIGFLAILFSWFLFGSIFRRVVVFRLRF